MKPKRFVIKGGHRLTVDEVRKKYGVTKREFKEIMRIMREINAGKVKA